MKKFVEFSVHEYMDMYPRTIVLSLEETKISEWVDYMNTNYSGGTTNLKRILTKEEAMEYVISTIEDVLKKPNVKTSDGSLDSIDVEFINNLVQQFKECYK